MLMLHNSHFKEKWHFYLWTILIFDIWYIECYVSDDSILDLLNSFNKAILCSPGADINMILLNFFNKFDIKSTLVQCSLFPG
jgi:hypothetical protein